MHYTETKNYRALSHACMSCCVLCPPIDNQKVKCQSDLLNQTTILEDYQKEQSKTSERAYNIHVQHVRIHTTEKLFTHM